MKRSKKGQRDGPSISGLLCTQYKPQVNPNRSTCSIGAVSCEQLSLRTVESYINVLN